MIDLDALAWMLIVFALVDLAVTLLLVRAALRVKEPALEERATASVILTFIALLMAILGAAYLLDFYLPDPLGTAILFGGLFLVSAPQVIWLVAYWRGAFR